MIVALGKGSTVDGSTPIRFARFCCMVRRITASRSRVESKECRAEKTISESTDDAILLTCEGEGLIPYGARSALESSEIKSRKLHISVCCKAKRKECKRWVTKPHFGTQNKKTERKRLRPIRVKKVLIVVIVSLHDKFLYFRNILNYE